MSIEAMAMAGMDYKECGINFEDWDRHCRDQPPLYLQTGQSICREVENHKSMDEDVEWMKHKLREWAKAVASKQESETIMSIEAMAMAGMDYKECGINFEEWDCHCREQPPLYLQTGIILCREEENKSIHEDAEWMKQKLREWAKAVVSKQIVCILCLK
ncbi:mitochondrial uncoupling protein 5-like [Senna tora]|uniref:Mitochondrial uncoupling protein 5-like n=1 Tax=Senna tora TaxID=362788 RepID=A0A834WX50_9FABA|nr:mitochondrial uncoupling protein 5-like [Senna tora]